MSILTSHDNDVNNLFRPLIADDRFEVWQRSRLELRSERISRGCHCPSRFGPARLSPLAKTALIVARDAAQEICHMPQKQGGEKQRAPEKATPGAGGQKSGRLDGLFTPFAISQACPNNSRCAGWQSPGTARSELVGSHFDER